MRAGEADVQTILPVCALIPIVQSLQLRHASVALTVFRDSWRVPGAAVIRDNSSSCSTKNQSVMHTLCKALPAKALHGDSAAAMGSVVTHNALASDPSHQHDCQPGIAIHRVLLVPSTHCPEDLRFPP